LNWTLLPAGLSLVTLLLLIIYAGETQSFSRPADRHEPVSLVIVDERNVALITARKMVQFASAMHPSSARHAHQVVELLTWLATMLADWFCNISMLSPLTKIA